MTETDDSASAPVDTFMFGSDFGGESGAWEARLKEEALARIDIKTHRHTRVATFVAVSMRQHVYRCLDCYASLTLDDRAALNCAGVEWVKVNFLALPPGVSIRVKNVPQEST